MSECEVGERAGRKNEVKDEVHGRDAYGGGRQGCELEKFKERRQEKEQGKSATQKESKSTREGEERSGVKMRARRHGKRARAIARWRVRKE